jgi:hypothetical protein
MTADCHPPGASTDEQFALIPPAAQQTDDDHHDDRAEKCDNDAGQIEAVDGIRYVKERRRQEAAQQSANDAHNSIAETAKALALDEVSLLRLGRQACVRKSGIQITVAESCGIPA